MFSFYRQEPSSVQAIREGYDRTVTGMGVLLGIVIVYGIVMSLIVGRDCIQQVFGHLNC